MIPPREVRVGLREPGLGQDLHHLRPGERLGQEHDLGVIVLHGADEPLPESDRLGVRVVHAERRHTVGDPEVDDAFHLVPERPRVLAIEVHRVDVLVLLGRILGVLDRSVRALEEPLGMLADVRMVG